MRYFKKKNKQPKIDKDLCIDVIQKLAEKVMNNIEYISFDYIDISMDGSTPLNSYYCWSGEDNYKAFWRWIGNYLKSITEKKHIKDVFKVYTDYEPCDAFVICVNNSDKKRYKELLAKYNCDTPYEIEPKWGEIIDKCCGSEVHPKDVDFSSWSDEDREFYEVFIEPRDLYIQFRDDNIMIDGMSYTGRNVEHIKDEFADFDKKRYNWCLDCIEGNFRKF